MGLKGVTKSAEGVSRSFEVDKNNGESSISGLSTNIQEAPFVLYQGFDTYKGDSGKRLVSFLLFDTLTNRE
jgi:hypothetical protein